MGKVWETKIACFSATEVAGGQGIRGANAQRI